MNDFAGAPAFNTIDFFAFLFLFSLLALPLSYLSRNRTFQNLLHIGLGSCCLFAVAPRLFLFYFGFWVVAYIFTLVARIERGGLIAYAKALVPIAILLAPMIFWKLDHVAFERILNLDLHQFIWNAWRPAGEIDAIYMLVAPLGLSFSVFRAVDLIAEVNIGIVEKPSFVSVLAYGFFAPVQIVGPISQYREVDRDIGDREARFALSRWGAVQIVQGAAKAFVLAWPLAWSAQIVVVFADQPLWVIWLCVAVYPVYLFLNFSGFSDMSIGIAALYGFKLEPNFNRPLLRSTLQQLWSNWHMSLTRFAQRNIFVPLGGYRPRTQYTALFFTMMTIALWHGLTLPFFLFGALHGAGLIIGRLYPLSRLVPSIGPARWGDWPINILGWALTYVFFMLTIQLALVDTDKILPFYASLFGARL